MTESRNYGITDRLKTVYPPKTSFCGGYNNLCAAGTKLLKFEMVSDFLDHPVHVHTVAVILYNCDYVKIICYIYFG